MADSPTTALPHSPSHKTPTRSRSKPSLRDQSRSPQARSPLQERTKSQNNEGPLRLVREVKQEAANFDVFSSTPFPTKPQHILLPSTIKKQKSFHHAENFPGFLGEDQSTLDPGPVTTSRSSSKARGDRKRKAPVVQLKKSVTTLRDMYEAQEKSSRPSTAASLSRHPSTSTSRLRSASSSESISGRYVWESLRQVSSDDLALLPTLNEATVKKMESQSSFASRMNSAQAQTSSPNFRKLGTSSPRLPVFRDEAPLSSDSVVPSSSSGLAEASQSPNFVRLGRSSSIAETATTQPSSSPNILKLGTSSPVAQVPSSPTPSIGSVGSLKRKRASQEEWYSISQRFRSFNSSPPPAVHSASESLASPRSLESQIIPSSPPEPFAGPSVRGVETTPVEELPESLRQNAGSSRPSSAHATLQAALSSSPMPPIQYPLVKAPALAGYTLNIPKRNMRPLTSENLEWSSRLSPVPSEWEEASRTDSRHSANLEDLEHDLMPSESGKSDLGANESQVHIIAEDDHHEASDELSALPRALAAFRSPPTIPLRRNSLYGTYSSSSGTQSQSRLSSLRLSVDSRLNSMKSFSHSRQNSILSGRPGSAGSSSPGTTVPTWARRYYSGHYRDSFQYLYNSQNNSLVQLQLQPTKSRPGKQPYQGEPAMPSNTSRRSWQSIRDSLRSSIVEHTGKLLPRVQSRLEARKSHMTTGIGPLVSHPTQSPNVMKADAIDPQSTIRCVSLPLPSTDPRAHWAGLSEEDVFLRGYHLNGPGQGHGQYADHRQRRFDEGPSRMYETGSGALQGRSRFFSSPHLHRDRRLNTGSSTSRGYGFPFNRRSRWRAPSVYSSSESRPSWFEVDLRSTQVTCFVLGFVLPLSWFVGAFLPLPKRPQQYSDVEKAEWDAATHNGTCGLRDWEEMDVVARLRLERHVRGLEEIKWQNARWWRRMNRWMCVVGLVVCVVVIVLAVIGTRAGW